MKKFDNDLRSDLFNYLKIENGDNSYIKEAINYLEAHHYTSVSNWHDDNYYNDCNYGLLFALCGLNGQRQQDVQEMFKDCFNVSLF